MESYMENYCTILQSNVCDYSHAFVVVKGTSTIETEDNRAIDGYNRNVILKNNAPFINYILKINNVLLSNTEDLDIVMLMYNLIEYKKKYSKISGSLWNYRKDILLDPIIISLFNIRQVCRKNSR